MKITNIETILAGQRYLFVKVHTDTGLVGYGECGAWCYQEATAECIHAMEHHLIGLDPLNIEYINNGLTRCMHFRGSVVMAALFSILTESLRTASNLRTLIQCVIILVIINFVPNGLFGEHEFKDIFLWLKKKFTGKETKTVKEAGK